MPSTSEKQRKFMGADLARKRVGEKTKTGMSEQQLSEFASKPNKRQRKKDAKRTANKRVRNSIPRFDQGGTASAGNWQDVVRREFAAAGIPGEAEYAIQVVGGEGGGNPANWHTPTPELDHGRLTGYSHGPFQLYDHGKLPEFYAQGYSDPGDITQAARYVAHVIAATGDWSPWHGAPPRNGGGGGGGGGGYSGAPAPRSRVINDEGQSTVEKNILGPKPIIQTKFGKGLPGFDKGGIVGFADGGSASWSGGGWNPANRSGGGGTAAPVGSSALQQIKDWADLHTGGDTELAGRLIAEGARMQPTAPWVGAADALSAWQDQQGNGVSTSYSIPNDIDYGNLGVAQGDLALQAQALQIRQQEAQIQDRNAQLDRQLQQQIANNQHAEAQATQAEINRNNRALEGLTQQRIQIEAAAQGTNNFTAAANALLGQMGVYNTERQGNIVQRGQDIDGFIQQLTLSLQQDDSLRRDLLARGAFDQARDVEARMRVTEQAGLQLTQRAQDIDVLGLSANSQLRFNDQMLTSAQMDRDYAVQSGDLNLQRQAEDRLRAANQQSVYLQAAQQQQSAQGQAAGVMGNMAVGLGNIEANRASEMARLAANPRDFMQLQTVLGNSGNFLDNLLSGRPMGAQSTANVGQQATLGPGWEQLVGAVTARPDMPYFQQAMDMAQQSAQSPVDLERLMKMGDLGPTQLNLPDFRSPKIQNPNVQGPPPLDLQDMFSRLGPQATMGAPIGARGTDINMPGRVGNLDETATMTPDARAVYQQIMRDHPETPMLDAIRQAKESVSIFGSHPPAAGGPGGGAPGTPGGGAPGAATQGSAWNQEGGMSRLPGSPERVSANMTVNGHNIPRGAAIVKNGAGDIIGFQRTPGTTGWTYIGPEVQLPEYWAHSGGDINMLFTNAMSTPGVIKSLMRRTPKAGQVPTPAGFRDRQSIGNRSMADRQIALAQAFGVPWTSDTQSRTLQGGSYQPIANPAMRPGWENIFQPDYQSPYLHAVGWTRGPDGHTVPTNTLGPGVNPMGSGPAAGGIPALAGTAIGQSQPNLQNAGSQVGATNVPQYAPGYGPEGPLAGDRPGSRVPGMGKGGKIGMDGGMMQAPGRRFITQEPIVGIGLNSGQPQFTLGENAPQSPELVQMNMEETSMAIRPMKKNGKKARQKQAIPGFAMGGAVGAPPAGAGDFASRAAQAAFAEGRGLQGAMAAARGAMQPGGGPPIVAPAPGSAIQPMPGPSPIGPRPYGGPGRGGMDGIAPPGGYWQQPRPGPIGYGGPGAGVPPGWGGYDPGYRGPPRIMPWSQPQPFPRPQPYPGPIGGPYPQPYPKPTMPPNYGPGWGPQRPPGYDPGVRPIPWANLNSSFPSAVAAAPGFADGGQASATIGDQPTPPVASEWNNPLMGIPNSPVGTEPADLIARKVFARGGGYQEAQAAARASLGRMGQIPEYGGTPGASRAYQIPSFKYTPYQWNPPMMPKPPRRATSLENWMAGHGIGPMPEQGAALGGQTPPAFDEGGQVYTPGEVLFKWQQGMTPQANASLLPSQREYMNSWISQLGVEPADWWQSVEANYPGGPNPASIYRGSF